MGPQQLTVEHKKRCVECAEAFLKANFLKGKAFLDSIVTMDETNVAFHTPETKQASKQWLPKGSRPPKKFLVQENRKKQMVIIWFDNMGLIYHHYVPVGTKVNTPYFCMTTFLKNFKFRKQANAKKEWSTAAATWPRPQRSSLLPGPLN